jgi:hypothetical protein
MSHTGQPEAGRLQFTDVNSGRIEFHLRKFSLIPDFEANALDDRPGFLSNVHDGGEPQTANSLYPKRAVMMWFTAKAAP